MKHFLKQYKTVIKFIITFLIVYSVLSLLYVWYLDFSKKSSYYPDFFTYVAAKGSEGVLDFIGYQTSVVKHSTEPSLKLIVRNNYLARVIEGCNSISIIILFSSFIVAFASNYRTTALYIVVGSVVVFLANILRIAILAMAIYHYPNYTDVLHTVVFPGIIYGTVFILWVLWVNRFSKLKQ